MCEIVGMIFILLHFTLYDVNLRTVTLMELCGKLMREMNSHIRIFMQ